MTHKAPDLTGNITIYNPTTNKYIKIAYIEAYQNFNPDKNQPDIYGQTIDLDDNNKPTGQKRNFALWNTKPRKPEPQQKTPEETQQ